MTSSESIPLKAHFYHRALLTEKWNRWYLVNPRDVYLHPISFKNLLKSFTQLLCTIWVLLLITRDYVPFFITIAEKHCGVTSQLRPEHLTAYPDGFKRKKEKKKVNVEAMTIKLYFEVLSVIPGQGLLKPIVLSTGIERSGEEAVISPD